MGAEAAEAIRNPSAARNPDAGPARKVERPGVIESEGDRFGAVTRGATSLALVLALGGCLSSHVAFTREDQLRWRTELQPRVRDVAVGPRAEWTDRNAQWGRLNGWRWKTNADGDRLFIYARDPEGCGHESEHPTDLFLLRQQGGKDQEWFHLQTDHTGVALDVSPGQWMLIWDDEVFEFDKNEDEAVLLLVEPWPVYLVHFYGPGADQARAEWRYRERSREMVAERCRRRRSFGTPIEDVRVIEPRRLDH